MQKRCSPAALHFCPFKMFPTLTNKQTALLFHSSGFFGGAAAVQDTNGR